MPLINVKIEGRGNGIKTVVTNILDIGKALNRPPSHLIKFCGWEVGSQVICDEKAQKYIINGVHDAERLQKVLDIFINMFVLCPLCKNPETDISVLGGVLYSNCKACGKRKKLNQKHKLTFFILKSPPTGKKDINISDIEHDMASLSCKSGVKKEEAEDEKIERVVSYIKNREILDEENKVEVVEKFGVKESIFLTLIMQYGMSQNILDDISTYENVLKAFGSSKRNQRAIIGGIERFLALEHPKLIDKTTDIFWKLYDMGILTKKYIIEWVKTESGKYVPALHSDRIRKAVEPLIEKLQYSK